jgi:hypothetical protein
MPLLSGSGNAQKHLHGAGGVVYAPRPMNAPRITLRAAICLAFLSFAATACDSGGSPKIRSFTASESNLPLPGGEVTLTWDVKSESSLELRPFPGAVHGTGITLSVGESTEFTLVAKGNGRTDRETIRVGVGDPFAVIGRVLRPGYGPAANFGVYVKGVTEPAFTNSVGNFRIEGVVAPYDLVILDPDIASSVIVYQGLTRPDPTVVALVASNPYSAGIGGTLSGVPFPTPTPPPASQTLVHTFMPAGFRSTIGVNAATGAWNSSLSWGNSSEASVKVTALRFVVGADGLPSTFPGYARSTEQIVDGVGLVVNPVLAPVPATSLSGSIIRDESLDSAYVWPVIDFGGQAVPQSAPTLLALADILDLPASLVGTSNTFQRSAPDVGVPFAMSAQGSSPTGSITHVRRNLSAGASGITLDLPAPPRPLLPVQNAVVTSGTQFAIQSDDQSVNYFRFELNGGQRSISVLTADDSITFPDLSELGIDGYFNGVVYYQSYGPYDSLDDAAGPMTFVSAGDDTYVGYSYESRSFTVPESN